MKKKNYYHGQDTIDYVSMKKSKNQPTSKQTFEFT